MQPLMDFAWVLIDCVFPSPQPRSTAETNAEAARRASRENEYERLIEGLSDNKDDLSTHLASVKELLDSEQERRQSVDARLTTIVGLTSIAGTVAIGAIVASRPSHGAAGLMLLLAMFYLVLQLCSAILGAILGLWRRGYAAGMPEDVLPAIGEVRSVQLRRQIRVCVATLAENRALTDSKVTMMAVSHRAMLNFLLGLVVFAVIGMVQASTARPTDELADRLRRDHTLRELLRGPMGNPGPKGDAGPQGPPGIPGPSRPANRRMSPSSTP